MEVTGTGEEGDGRRTQEGAIELSRTEKLGLTVLCSTAALPISPFTSKILQIFV